MKVDVLRASWSVEARQIISSVDLSARPGEFVGLIGPNGSGKSSLLRLIYRMYPLESGLICLDEKNISEMKNREVAQSMAVVAQERATDFDFTVYEIVMMGRTPHKKLLDKDAVEDDEIVQQALNHVNMLSFAERNFYTLSGGEKQRALIARALAQRARVLLLDEPTNHLDIRYQLEILELLRSLKITIIAALHDLNIAAAYCDRLYLLQAGKILESGEPKEVLTPPQIKAAYGVNVVVTPHPSTGRLHVAYVGIANPT